MLREQLVDFGRRNVRGGPQQRLNLRERVPRASIEHTQLVSGETSLCAAYLLEDDWNVGRVSEGFYHLRSAEIILVIPRIPLVVGSERYIRDLLQMTKNRSERYGELFARI